MPAIVTPTPAVQVRQDAPVDFAVLSPEKQAEALQKQVRLASIRNDHAVEASKRQATEVQKFETRARETLRDLLEDMGRGNDRDAD